MSREVHQVQITQESQVSLDRSIGGEVYQRIGRPCEASLVSRLTRVIPSIWDWEFPHRCHTEEKLIEHGTAF